MPSTTNILTINYLPFIIKLMKHFFSWLLIWLGLSTAHGELMEGKCAYVQDGDSLKLQIPGQEEEVSVRLHGIDAPEKNQAFSEESRAMLRRLTQGKNIRVDVQNTDRYGRYLGKVYVGKTYVNLELVKAGLAWHYDGSRDADIEQAEAAARKAHKGLWSDASAINPREYRKKHGTVYDNRTAEESATSQKTPSVSIGAVLTGKCAYVQDGDSLKFIPDGETEEIRVRLYGIDAPEKGQEFSGQSREQLRKLTLKKSIRVVVQDTDRYGRYIGKVYVGNTYVNKEMLRAGLAWYYGHHADSSKDADLEKAQQAARQAKKGLWSSADAVNPRAFREKNGTIYQ